MTPHWSFDVLFMGTQKTFVKVVSDLKARLDYSEDPARSVTI